MLKITKSHVLRQLISRLVSSYVSCRLTYANLYILIFITLYPTLPIHTANAAAFTEFNGCQQQFLQARPPSFAIKNSTQVDSALYRLCFNGFAVLYSSETKNPLWTAEYLTKKRLNQASTLERIDNFHEERDILTKDRARLVDYKKSGYDRGHLAPNADMANFAQQYDSFSLANIVPQSPHLNRSVWREVESITRYYVKKHVQAYTITGAIYEGNLHTGKDTPFNNHTKLAKLNQSVAIPSHIYKAIYLPTIKQAGVYIAPNDESGRVGVLSLAEFSKRTGIDAFPSLLSQPVQPDRLSEPLYSASSTLSAQRLTQSTELTPLQSDNDTSRTDSNLESDRNNHAKTAPWWRQLIVGMMVWMKQQLAQ